MAFICFVIATVNDLFSTLRHCLNEVDWSSTVQKRIKHWDLNEYVIKISQWYWYMGIRKYDILYHYSVVFSVPVLANPCWLSSELFEFELWHARNVCRCLGTSNEQVDSTGTTSCVTGIVGNYRIALKFGRHIGSTAKFHSDRIILNTNLAASRLCEILRKGAKEAGTPSVLLLVVGSWVHSNNTQFTPLQKLCSTTQSTSRLTSTRPTIIYLEF